MKAYTDVDQSKKLAEILPLETADMYYSCGAVVPNVMTSSKQDYKCYTICWSLAALLDVLNKTAYFMDEDASVDLSSYKTIEWDLGINNSDVGLVTESNPVDACFEMIIILKEKNLL